MRFRMPVRVRVNRGKRKRESHAPVVLGIGPLDFFLGKRTAPWRFPASVSEFPLHR